MDINDQLTFRDPPNICATTMSGFSSGTRSDYDEGIGACCCPGKKWKIFYQKWNGIRICLICPKKRYTHQTAHHQSTTQTTLPAKIGGVNTGIHEASLKQESTNRFVVLAGMIIVIILVIIIIVIMIIIVISL